MRFHTRGYTGRKDKDQRDEIFYIGEDLNKIMEYVGRYTNSLKKPKELNAFDFTHYVRGELFVHIDTLLTTYFEKANPLDITEAQLSEIFNIFESYCVFYCNWLGILQNYFQDVIL